MLYIRFFEVVNEIYGAQVHPDAGRSLWFEIEKLYCNITTMQFDKAAHANIIERILTYCHSAERRWLAGKRLTRKEKNMIVRLGYDIKTLNVDIAYGSVINGNMRVARRAMVSHPNPARNAAIVVDSPLFGEIKDATPDKYTDECIGRSCNTYKFMYLAQDRGEVARWAVRMGNISAILLTKRYLNPSQMFYNSFADQGRTNLMIRFGAKPDTPFWLKNVATKMTDVRVLIRAIAHGSHYNTTDLAKSLVAHRVIPRVLSYLVPKNLDTLVEHCVAHKILAFKYIVKATAQEIFNAAVKHGDVEKIQLASTLKPINFQHAYENAAKYGHIETLKICMPHCKVHHRALQYATQNRKFECIKLIQRG